MAYLLMIGNNCENLYWNPSKIVVVMVCTKFDKNCVKLFWNPSTIVEVIVQTNSDAHANASAHINRTVIVTTMARSQQAGATKNCTKSRKCKK